MNLPLGLFPTQKARVCVFQLEPAPDTLCRLAFPPSQLNICRAKRRLRCYRMLLESRRAYRNKQKQPHSLRRKRLGVGADQEVPSGLYWNRPNLKTNHYSVHRRFPGVKYAIRRYMCKANDSTRVSGSASTQYKQRLHIIKK